MNSSREHLLLKELGRSDGSWRKGETVAVSLTLGRRAAGRPDLLIAFAVTAQLLGRMDGTVRALHLVAPVETPARIAALLRASGPLDGACAAALQRVRRVAIVPNAPERAIAISIGAPARDANIDLWCDADGWLALIGEGEGRLGPGAPAGAIAASCLLVNELFQLVHARERTSARRYRFSVWDMCVNGEPGPDLTLEGLDLGAANLAGAGAVSQSALWSAAAAGVRLQVSCGDDDTIDDTNLARLSFADHEDIGAYKTDVLARGMAGSSVTFAGDHRRFEDLRASTDRPLLFAVDDDQARATLQQLAPPLALSATTGALVTTIEWSDLDPGYACISCGHPIVSGPSPSELAARFGIDAQELAGVLSAERAAVIERAEGVASGTLAHLVGRATCDQLNEVARLALGIGGPTGSVAFNSWLAGLLLFVELIAHLTTAGRSRPRRRLLPLMNPGRMRPKNPRPRAACSCQQPFFRESYAAIRRARQNR